MYKINSSKKLTDKGKFVYIFSVYVKNYGFVS